MEKNKNTQRDAIINDFIDIPFSTIIKISNFIKKYNNSNFWHCYFNLLFTIKSKNYDEISEKDTEFMYYINSVSMFFEEFNNFLCDIKKTQEE